MKTFKELIVWQKAHQLVLNIYKITRCFPKEELYGLVGQIRRSSSSIPTNIAEGFKRKSTKDYLHFLNMADASLEETKYHILLSFDLSYISKENFDLLNTQCEEIGRMLNGLQKKLSAKM